jgi:hypothetical protein
MLVQVAQSLIPAANKSWFDDKFTSAMRHFSAHWRHGQHLAQCQIFERENEQEKREDTT